MKEGPGFRRKSRPLLLAPHAGPPLPAGQNHPVSLQGMWPAMPQIVSVIIRPHHRHD